MALGPLAGFHEPLLNFVFALLAADPGTVHTLASPCWCKHFSSSLGNKERGERGEKGFGVGKARASLSLPPRATPKLATACEAAALVGQHWTDGRLPGLTDEPPGT